MKRKTILVIASLLLLPLVPVRGQDVVVWEDEPSSQMELLGFKKAAAGRSVDISAQILEQHHGEWPMDNNGNEPCACIIVRVEQVPPAEVKNLVYKFEGGSDIKGEPVVRTDKDEPDAILFVDPSKRFSMRVSHPRYGSSGWVSGQVVESKQMYEVTLRYSKKQTINVITTPSGLEVTLSDLGVTELSDSASTATFTEVPLGRHSLIISQAGSVKLSEEIVVTDVNNLFQYDVRERKTVRFVSIPSGATLSIDGKVEGETPLSLELPYGSCMVRAVVGPGQETSKYVVIGDNTPAEIDLGVITSVLDEAEEDLSRRRASTITSPRSTKSSALSPFGAGVALVRKSFVTKGEGEKITENGAWGPGEGSDWMTGVQVGAFFQPDFGYGLGLYTGLYYELYSSSCDSYDSYDKFTEHCLYIPVHVLYSLPAGRSVAFRFHGGFGVNYVLSGVYKDSDGEYDNCSPSYGSDLYPKKLNLTLELGVGVRLGPIQLNAQYGMGLIDQGMYASYEDYSTKENRMTFGVSFKFGDFK